MKRVRIFLIALLSLFCVSLSAQVFVGGNFGLNTSGGKTSNGSTTDKPATLGFNISPRAGIFLSEKLAAGSSMDISFSRYKSAGDPATITRSTSFGLSPFLRYYAIKWNNFSVFSQGTFGLSFSGSTTKVGDTSTEGPKTTSLGLIVSPGLAYDVTDKLALETSLNILSFGYNYSIQKSGSTKDINSSFNMGAGLDNIKTLGTISIGAIYKF